jgi:hypothetical protein
MNTQFNRLLGCPLSLHGRHVNPLAITAEAVEFGHRPPEPTTASLRRQHDEIRRTIKYAD